MIDIELPTGYSIVVTGTKDCEYYWQNSDGEKSEMYKSMIGVILSAKQHAGRINIKTKWNFSANSLKLKVIAGGKFLEKDVSFTDLVQTPDQAPQEVFNTLTSILEDMLDLNLCDTAHMTIKDYLADNGLLRQQL